MNYSIPFVCAFGIITVFCSLIVIVILSSAMTAATAAPEQDPQLMAAITAALAEDLGVGFQNVRITAIKKI